MGILIVFFWVFAALVVAGFGTDREIGFWPAFLLSLFLSPLIGAIFVATSKKTKTAPPLTPEGLALAQKATAKYNAHDYEGALNHYLELLTTNPLAPVSNFRIACLYSLLGKKEEAFKHLARAVEQGYNNFQGIKSSPDLAWLRNQAEFAAFAQGGYKIVPSRESDDTISKIERLGELKAKGLLTADEFEHQKKKILGIG